MGGLTWWPGLRAELQGLFDLLLPPACPLCGDLLPAGVHADELCRRCQADIVPIRSPRCPRCSFPYPTEDGTDHLCENCLRHPPAFAWVVAVGLYAGALRAAVHRFKYREGILLDRCLGKMMAAAITREQPDFRPDLLVPVPLHRRRLQQRTYNQALLLAQQLGRFQGVPVAPRLLRRQRATTPQQGLDLVARKQNLRHAFTLTGSLEGKSILLIDDVLTTGTTANECCRLLQKAGAVEIGVAVLGRVPRGEIFKP